jgi:hypothetical protein
MSEHIDAQEMEGMPTLDTMPALEELPELNDMPELVDLEQELNTFTQIVVNSAGTLPKGVLPAALAREPNLPPGTVLPSMADIMGGDAYQKYLEHLYNLGYAAARAAASRACTMHTEDGRSNA